MKKVFLFASAALFAATVLVSCGSAVDAEKAKADSLLKASEEAAKNMINNAGGDSNKVQSTTGDTAKSKTTEVK